jgi:hypothetical protein
MIQEVLIVLIFIAAVAYLGRMVVRHFYMKEDCSSGCGKCGIDFTKIEKQILDKKG